MPSRFINYPPASLQRVRPKLPFHTPICLCPGKFIGVLRLSFLCSSTYHRPLFAFIVIAGTPILARTLRRARIALEKERTLTRLSMQDRKHESLVRSRRDPLHSFPSSLFTMTWKYSPDSWNRETKHSLISSV